MRSNEQKRTKDLTAKNAKTQSEEMYEKLCKFCNNPDCKINNGENEYKPWSYNVRDYAGIKAYSCLGFKSDLPKLRTDE